MPDSVRIPRGVRAESVSTRRADSGVALARAAGRASPRHIPSRPYPSQPWTPEPSTRDCYPWVQTSLGAKPQTHGFQNQDRA